MIRNCDGTDEFLIGEDGRPCRCGATFDDVDHVTIYPHNVILTREERQELIRSLTEGIQGGDYL